jgi:hypothetical protein
MGAISVAAMTPSWSFGVVVAAATTLLVSGTD